MTKGAKSLSAMQMLNDSNTTNDYHDENNGVLYNLVPSKTFHSFIVTFFTQQTFDEITKLLNAEYTFKRNSNGSATSATTEARSQKVVLTLYKSKKLLTQGIGSWEWRNTIFRDLSGKLTRSISEDVQVNSGNTPNRLRSESTHRENRTSSLINKMINTLLNKIISPRAASTPVHSETVETRQMRNKKSTTKTKKTSSDPAVLSGSCSGQNDSVVVLDPEDAIIRVTRKDCIHCRR